MDPDLNIFAGDLASHLNEGRRVAIALTQEIHGLSLEPTPEGVTVRFRTALRTRAEIRVFPALSTDILSDKAAAGARMAYRVSGLTAGNGLSRHQEFFGATAENPMPQNTLFWVEVTCQNQSLINGPQPGLLSLTRQFRTWQRSAIHVVERVDVSEDSDPHGSGEIWFLMRLFDAISALPLSATQHAYRSIDSGQTAFLPFGGGVPLPAAPRYLGTWFQADDDDSVFGYSYLSSGPERFSAPGYWTHSSSTSEISSVNHVDQLPIAEGKYALRLNFRSSRSGEPRYVVHSLISGEVVKTPQPQSLLIWHGEFDSLRSRRPVDSWLEVGAGEAMPLALDPEHGQLVILRSLAGELMLLRDSKRGQELVWRENGGFDQLVVRRPASPGEPMRLLAGTGQRGLLRIGTLSLAKGKIGVDWTIQMTVTGRWHWLEHPGGESRVLACDGEGRPVEIDLDGKVAVLGPRPGFEVATLAGNANSRGIQVLAIDTRGNSHALVEAGSKKANWIDLPAGLGRAFASARNEREEPIYFGLDSRRRLRAWSPGRREARDLGPFEELQGNPDPQEVLAGSAD